MSASEVRDPDGAEFVESTSIDIVLLYQNEWITVTHRGVGNGCLSGGGNSFGVAPHAIDLTDD